MDAKHFDAIAKTLSSGANRRSLLMRLVGGVLAAFGWQDVDAKLKKAQRRKKRRHSSKDQSKSKQKRRASRKGQSHSKKQKRQQVEAQNKPGQTPPRPQCVPAGPCQRTADCCPTETCGADGFCTATPGSEQASCIATGCPLSTNQCQIIECDQQSGLCVPHDLPDDTACNDNNVCTRSDVCVAGQCVGLDPVTCPAGTNQCKEPICDPVTGCGFRNRPNDTVCGTATGCGGPPTCQEGTCVPPAGTACPVCTRCNSLAGTCQAATGAPDERCPDSVFQGGGQVCCGRTCCHTQLSSRTGPPTEMCCPTVASPTSPEQFQCLPRAQTCPRVS
jgi:hypothetical protein